MLNINPKHMKSNSAPFVPRGPTVERWPMISEVDTFNKMSVTGFVFPSVINNAYPVQVSNGHKSGNMDTQSYMYSYIPSLADFHARIAGLGGSLSRDVAGFDWFMKIFKYCVYPQIVNAELLYAPGTTQYKLLTNVRILLTDQYSPGIKSLLFQARNTPSSYSPVKAKTALIITNERFAEWMHHAMLINVGFPTMVAIATVMFGEQQIAGSSKNTG